MRVLGEVKGVIDVPEGWYLLRFYPLRKDTCSRGMAESQECCFNVYQRSLRDFS